MDQIYLATVLLERNRWSTRVPSLLVSEWIPRIRQAGFDGLELWENHVLGQTVEIEAIRQSSLPVRVFNTYLTFEEPETRWREVATAIQRLGAARVKFNVGNTLPLDESKRRLLAFADMLPNGCQLLCECHGGTPLEEVDAIQAFYADLPARFGLILHGVGDPAAIRARCHALVDRLRHIHVSTRAEDKTSGRLDACVKAILAEGFRGSWSIEFTETSQTPEQERLENTFAHAVDDLRALRVTLG